MRATPGSDATHTGAFNHNVHSLGNNAMANTIVTQLPSSNRGHSASYRICDLKLLKTPLGTTHDLFQVLDTCVRYVDAWLNVTIL